MARHRKMEFAEDEDPKMDISSLIDCCFLLLLYFIVCTSIVQERKLDMAMPGNAATASGPKTPLQPGLVVVEASGVISWGQVGGDKMVIDTDMKNHELPTLVSSLEEFKSRADSIGSKPIVQLRVEGEVPMQRVIDVLNAFAKADITDVGLTNVADE